MVCTAVLLTGHCLGDEIKMNEMAGHVARLGNGRHVYMVLVGRLRKRGHLEDLGIDGRKLLSWILKKVMGVHGLD
jgi:hypothetical protein